jgi:hypothetical protein
MAMVLGGNVCLARALSSVRSKNRAQFALHGDLESHQRFDRWLVGERSKLDDVIVHGVLTQAAGA